MDSLSAQIIATFLPFSVLFSKPSWDKALTLLFGTLVCTGKRTVCSALRAMGLGKISCFSKYHHLLNRTKWSALQASKILFFKLVAYIKEKDSLVFYVDETLERRKGKKIRAKGYYRDAVRSSGSQPVISSGLKWLVLSLSFKIPFVSRTLALPFLSVLQFSKKHDLQRNLRHKTTIHWTIQMIKQVYRWIGRTKKLIIVGDGGFAAGQLALECIHLGVTLISRLKMNAALYHFPAKRMPGQRGRKALKGSKLMNFKQMLSLTNLPWQEVEIIGYGGKKRIVRYLSNTCMWGADGTMPIPIRWVLVIDPQGKLDPLPLMSTDPTMDPKQIIELYIDRWSLEVTFEETREHLGVETQRQWSDKAIARSTPILMGLYSLVYLMIAKSEQSIEIEQTAWYQKENPTFSDILRAVRMTIWKDYLISGKAKLCPSWENITPEMAQWTEYIVKVMLQAA